MSAPRTRDTQTYGNENKIWRLGTSFFQLSLVFELWNTAKRMIQTTVERKQQTKCQPIITWNIPVFLSDLPVSSILYFLFLCSTCQIKPISIWHRDEKEVELRWRISQFNRFLLNIKTFWFSDSWIESISLGYSRAWTPNWLLYIACIC
jgi:hypothetical protein